MFKIFYETGLSIYGIGCCFAHACVMTFLELLNYHAFDFLGAQISNYTVHANDIAFHNIDKKLLL